MDTMTKRVSNYQNQVKTNMSYQFDKARHLHSFNGIPLHGVTTVLGVISKPALIGWASGQAVEYVKGHWKVGKAYSKEERDDILAEAKGAHSRKKDNGADVGTRTHEAVELYTKSGQEYQGGDEQISPMFLRFKEWAESVGAKFLESEKNVWSEELWIGGILDFIVEIDGKVYIGDLKTSSAIYKEHFLQMGAYHLCLEEMGYDKIDGYIVVCIDKSGKLQTAMREDTEQFKEGFRHALGLHKTLKNIEM